MKKIFDRMFGQYKGLRRELYVLFWGKAATNMGAMIWPMLTLILSNKLGMSAEEIARITIAMGIIQFPANLLSDRGFSPGIHDADYAVFYSRSLSDHGKSVL